MGFVYGALSFVLCGGVGLGFVIGSVPEKQSTKDKEQSTTNNSHDSGTEIVQGEFFARYT